MTVCARILTHALLTGQVVLKGNEAVILKFIFPIELLLKKSSLVHYNINRGISTTFPIHKFCFFIFPDAMMAKGPVSTYHWKNSFMSILSTAHAKIFSMRTQRNYS